MYACGFRFYFTPLPGFFSPFPHGTCSLSVEDPYLALEDGPPIFRQGFSCPALLFVILVPTPNFHLRAYHPLRIAFPYNSVGSVCIYNRLLPVRSPLLRESRLISFPRVTEMFQFARFASLTYVFSKGYPKRMGFPIRRPWDQCSIANSPTLFAGLHVLHRQSSPRHPPQALGRLIL